MTFIITLKNICINYLVFCRFLRTDILPSSIMGLSFLKYFLILLICFRNSKSCEQNERYLFSCTSSLDLSVCACRYFDLACEILADTQKANDHNQYSECELADHLYTVSIYPCPSAIPLWFSVGHFQPDGRTSRRKK